MILKWKEEFCKIYGKSIDTITLQSIISFFEYVLLCHTKELKKRTSHLLPTEKEIVWLIHNSDKVAKAIDKLYKERLGL